MISGMQLSEDVNAFCGDGPDPSWFGNSAHVFDPRTPLTTSCTVSRGSSLRWLVEPCVVGAEARALIVAEYRVTGLSPMVIAERCCRWRRRTHR